MEREEERNNSMSTGNKIEMGRVAAEKVAREQGTVNARSVRTELGNMGLLGGDERWIGFIFKSNKFVKESPIGQSVKSTDKLRRKFVNSYRLAAAV